MPVLSNKVSGKIYYLKASNTQDFCIYTPDTSRFDSGNWTSESLPLGNRDSFDGKKPKKGTSIAAYEPGKCIYVLRGSNSQGFWKYQADTLDTMLIGWKKMKEIPLGTRAPRDGSGMVAVNKTGTDYIFTMKGSRTSEFYLYDIANNYWTALSSPPLGLSGRLGYKKGSCLTYDDNGFVYVLKGNYGDFFKYSIEGDSWYELRRYDAKVFRNREGRKKRIKDGSAIAYLDNNIYLLKGSNTYEFWMYSIAGDTWIQLDVYWDIPTGIGKKVKGGGALIKFGNHFYATKGNRTSEFYRHLLPIGAITLASNPPLLDGTMANKLTDNQFKLMVVPNPTTNHALVKYSLLKKGTVTLKLYNIGGELVKSYTNPNPVKDGTIRIETKELASGIYILRFISSKVKTTRKLVIEK